MAREDAYNAAAAAFSMYGSLLKDVAEELGADRALRFHAKQGDNFGTMLSGMLKERLGDADPDVATVRKVVSEAGGGFGFDPEIQETDTSVSFTYPACPIYDGLKMAGWTHEEIREACHKTVEREMAVLRESYPGLSGGLAFRPTPDSPCVESFSLRIQA